MQAWKEGGSLFSEIERAALAWAESVGGSLRPHVQFTEKHDERRIPAKSVATETEPPGNR